GSQANGQSHLDNQAAPLSALAQHQAGRVTSTDYAQQASTTERESVPHSTAPLVTLSARGSLVATAGGPMAFAVGETLNLGSGEHTSLAAGEHLRLHSGQALGITAGTQGATGVGIHVGAAKGPVQIEAQHGALTFASDDDLQVISNTQLNLAAAESIKLATAGGAYIEIKDGNITFGCPGQLTVEASAHQLGPAAGLSTSMNQRPDNAFNFLHQGEYQLLDEAGEPVANYRYTLVRQDGSRVQGVTNSQGMVTLQKGESFEN